MIYAAGLRDLDVCFVAGEPRISLVGSLFDVEVVHPDDALEEELAWSVLPTHDRRTFLGLCLRVEILPLSKSAADLYARIDERARATLALRYLEGAAKHEATMRARIEREVERLRGELETSREVWAKVSGICDVLIGDRA